jgi:hypothetical protein
MMCFATPKTRMGVVTFLITFMPSYLSQGNFSGLFDHPVVTSVIHQAYFLTPQSRGYHFGNVMLEDAKSLVLAVVSAKLRKHITINHFLD